MNIKSSDVVLEVGSGNNPNPQSDILCDRYLHDNGERAGEFGIVIDRPFVVADGYHLPFADKTFNYVICSHILEHMEDPKAFVKEIERVGKRGYIEVPSALSERIFGWDFHHWYCSLEHETLVFRKKTQGEQFGGFFHRLIAQTIWFRRFFENYENEMYIKYEWDGHINLRVERHEPNASWIRTLDARAWKILLNAKPDRISDIRFFSGWMAGRVQRKIRKVFRMLEWNIQKRLFPIRSITTLVSFLRCPICHHILETNDTKSSMHCIHCHHKYPIKLNTIPVLLSEKQIQQGY
jgi:uncharacterized protein YbaR (Trm112 family)/SAM-dependent methyltransferase